MKHLYIFVALFAAMLAPVSAGSLVISITSTPITGVVQFERTNAVIVPPSVQ